MSIPSISIITVNYNEWESTRAFLNSLKVIDSTTYEVLVVDNGSDEFPQKELREQFPQVQFIRSEKNLGFAGGNNLALDQAKGTYLFFVNNDTLLLPNTITPLLRQLENDETLGGVCPLLLFDELDAGNYPVIQFAGTTPIHPLTGRNKTLGRGMPFRGGTSSFRSIPYLHGAAMMLRRAAIDQVGSMDEQYFLYYEEVDWSVRLRQVGYTLGLEPRAQIIHKESHTIGLHSPIKVYFLNRNRLLFMRKFHSSWQISIFFLYYLTVVFPKKLITFALKGQWPQFRALCRAVQWHFQHPIRVN